VSFSAEEAQNLGAWHLDGELINHSQRRKQMKRVCRAKLLTMAAALAFLGAGCGGTLEEELANEQPGVESDRSSAAAGGSTWFPGHYANVINSQAPAPVINRIRNNPYIRGIAMVRYWGEIESTPGKYDFSAFRSAVKLARAAGKKVMIGPKWKTFNKDARARKCAPAYMFQNGWARQEKVGKKQQDACNISYWEPGARKALVRLVRALGQEFGNDPAVAGIYFPSETSGGSCPSGKWGLPKCARTPKQAAFYDTLVAVAKAGTTGFPGRAVLQYSNSIAGGSLGMSQLQDRLMAAGAGVAGPDLKMVDSNSMRQYKKRKDRMPVGTDTQSIGKHNKAGIEAAYRRACVEPKGLNVNFLFWYSHRKPSTGWHLEQHIFPLLKKYKGRVNTTCPSNICK
jgi:hypothetical protein